MNLQNKTIVISGVTGGVGKALSLRFNQLGWNIVGLSRNKVKMQELAENLGNNFNYIKVDFMSEKSILHAFNVIESKHINIDLIVNNAAVFKLKEFYECSFQDINRIIDTNLKGVMYTTLEAIKIMKKSKRPSRIVNIGSVASIHGIKNQAIYCASKFGLNGFAEALNQEIIVDNISITTLFPGGIDTPLWNKDNPYPEGSMDMILKADDVVKFVEMVSNLEPRIILKNMTIFPSNEWH